MLRLKDVNEFNWIKEETVRIHFDSEDSPKVLNLMPNRYEYYCKILHPVYLDKNIKDESIFYSQSEPPSEDKPMDFNYGKRTTFKTLAEKYNLPYTKEISSSTLASALGGYPRYLILGGEGSTDENTLRELVSIFKPFTKHEQCYFKYDYLKVINEFHDFQDFETGLFYFGKLDDVLSMYHKGDHIGLGSPTYWWAEDKSWCLHTNYDADFTLVGGNKELMEALFASEELECVEVDLDTGM
ncbi:hypothetical protein [Ornithinibacillus halotolerans]|uniref:Uncharacterized protein n=1 Tax=Ornithinibacillus halotolerans TaxID=1274357 RepID=A0A916SAD2_9BACI|nr:hypothetical protein [Ornithinibacillus halotolerans]GGA90657.1 hypothetical protein GCM10008025_36480 [Ornithinibacillus halotolerans]